MWLGGAAVWWIKELLNSVEKNKLQQCFHFTVCPPPPFFYFYFTPQFLPSSSYLPSSFCYLSFIEISSTPSLSVFGYFPFPPSLPICPPLSLSILFFFFSSRMLSQLSLF